MAQSPQANNQSMQDFFATQGILAVSAALLLLLLHLTVPDYCTELLAVWKQYSQQTPTPGTLWEMALQWFA